MITFLAHHRRVCLVSAGIITFLIVPVAPSTREDCAEFSPCDRLKSASIVLVADVLRADQPAVRIDESHAHMIPQRVRLRVVERFKGASADQRELDANIAVRSAEAVFLAPGQRYLIYARMREDGTWDTACSGTKPIGAALEDLQQLRQCRLPAREIRALEQPEIEDQESYAVYAAVIDQADYKADPILIGNLTLANPRRCVPRVSSDLSAWREAAQDFVRRSGSRLRLTPRLPLRARYRLVSSADLVGDMNRPWKGGIIRYVEFSAVGFDTQRTRAIVQRDHSCANSVDCADGATVFLQKESGTWRVVSPEGVNGCVWIS